MAPPGHGPDLAGDLFHLRNRFAASAREDEHDLVRDVRL